MADEDQTVQAPETEAAAPAPEPAPEPATPDVVNPAPSNPELAEDMTAVPAEFDKAWVRREISLALLGESEETRAALNP